MAKKVPGCWVTKNGTKYYRARLDLGESLSTGKRITKDFYGKTQKEAVKKMKDYENRNGINIDSSTLGGFMYDWLWNVKRNSIKPTTFERWEGIYRKYIKQYPGIHNARLDSLNNMFFQKVTNELLKEKVKNKTADETKNDSKYTVNQIKRMNDLIKMCLDYAVNSDILNVNPMKQISYPVSFECSDEKINYIDSEQQKELVSALDGDPMKNVIITGMATGMRLGEILALTNKDIDFSNKCIHINKAVKYAWTGKRDKTGKKIYEYRVWIPKTKNSIRDVPMSDNLERLFKEQMAINAFHQSENEYVYRKRLGLLFCDECGNFIDSKKPNRHLKQALKKANIEQDIHFHSLRHIFITNCVSADINPKTVMNWVGHSDIRVTLNIYAEINKMKDKKEFNKLDDFF